jgi:hypothetical protein
MMGRVIEFKAVNEIPPLLAREYKKGASKIEAPLSKDR